MTGGTGCPSIRRGAATTNNQKHPHSGTIYLPAIYRRGHGEKEKVKGGCRFTSKSLLFGVFALVNIFLGGL